MLRLYMAAKGVAAAPSLLDSYNNECSPIIAEMPKLSSALFNNFVQAKSRLVGRIARTRGSVAGICTREA